jgi:tRNA dimethylallyltransferase
MKNKIIVIVGPTASGKTNLSIELAEKLNSEIINADSRQVYKFMDIGTAKPTKEELQRVKHYFIDRVKPDEHYDAGMFGKEGREIIELIIKQDKIPIVSGGSGLYIKSLVDGLFDGPERDENIRAKIEERLLTEGIDSLYKELCDIDHETYQKIQPNNKHRIIRALEVYYLTGVPISKLHKMNKIEINFLPVFFGLHWERKVLYQRINQRTIGMINSGLVEEVKKLLDMGYNKNLKSFKTVGYKEPIEFIEGKISYDEMISLIQQYTRNYAKRQLTWFRADKRINWVDANKNTKEIIDEIMKLYKSS